MAKQRGRKKHARGSEHQKSTRSVGGPLNDLSKDDETRPYYGVQEPDYSEGGGFGRHKSSSFGQSQEGSRNPSGNVVLPKVRSPDKKDES